MIMWSAVSLRIRAHGSPRSPSHGSTTGPGTTRTPSGLGGGGWLAGLGTFGPASRNDRTSFLVTRPASPDPGIPVMSRLCSAAILRTSGLDLVRRRSSRVPGACWTAGGGWTAGRLDGWTAGGWTAGRLDGWTAGGGWTAGRLDGWTAGGVGLSAGV